MRSNKHEDIKRQDCEASCWNVDTMLDKANHSRYELRAALLAHELSRLNIKEVRFSDEGSLEKHAAGPTLFWSGKPSTDRRLWE